ncbi:MAG: 23S rRNA (guanosine(2251)-2'-O)-methyltransferase RlmB [Prolixibacteraceae bacterium]|jgi:23S rRNA (guanosine2251-2'-O)-methyltransferase|nr:23S rRNA (guanosine(2251)-2'-O)-methyltransferase RlmB [Prolixibacteraceae bacterium]MDI9564597.1 23S rRNA (guanosine(2251)-2'-O)-methyltransferase RlmB [Bacteroidota bacterium]NLT00609.1 23S rRNA (guanosine(2251)-2'-O)-methyltransferase RlmB [Bacteroidales bacterium]OQB78759.1 MAG: putative TrmH family tRNA/rRNA methyltransferase [Bacteroidetes bacterium ADurb.Bin123]HNU78004.1 23S rRNA (guanosine(2251)-2'-O)-methyltransferase RlmB [Prolixibacteraceae bacterium]
MESKKAVVRRDDFIFGTRAVMEAIRAGRPIDKVLIRNGLSNELFGELYGLIRENGVAFQYVPAEKMDRITRKNHQGVIALLSVVEFHRLEDLLPGIYERGEDPLILVLDQVTDVRNFGAIVRSAECAGVHAVIIPEKGAARVNEDAMKTSAGALNLVPVCRVSNPGKAVDFLRQSGVRVVAATEKGGNLYTAAVMAGPLAIIVGSEEHGISPILLQKADELVKIPLFGKIGSLNVSVAASLMLFEAVRQRNAS